MHQGQMSLQASNSLYLPPRAQHGSPIEPPRISNSKLTSPEHGEHGDGGQPQCRRKPGWSQGRKTTTGRPVNRIIVQIHRTYLEVLGWLIITKHIVRFMIIIVCTQIIDFWGRTIYGTLYFLYENLMMKSVQYSRHINVTITCWAASDTVPH